MDLTQIRYFLALAKTLNFTRAAEICNVTQPALTKSIQRLEGELGGALLRRERINTQLTPLGMTMLPLLQHTFDAAETARHSALRFRQQDVARLCVGLSPGIDPAVILPLLREVHRRFEGLRVTLRHGSAASLNDWLLASELDVLLTGYPEQLPDRVQRWPIFTDPIVALLPEGHALEAAEHVRIDQLRESVMIGRMTPAQSGSKGAADIDIDASLNVTQAIHHHGSSEESVQALVRAGMGIALCTSRRTLQPGIACRPVIPAKAVDVFVAAMAGRAITQATDAFLRLARARDWAA